MISKYLHINHRQVISLLLAVIWLSLATGPALANAPSPAAHSFEAGHNSNLAPCANYEDIGVLGREGGLLGLLGVGGHRDPISAAIVTGKTYTMRPVQHASATYVIYVKTECLGSKGELLFSKTS